MICARCGQAFDEYPALSRLDNKTEICPSCGELEAMEQYMFGHVPNWLGIEKENENVQS